MSVPQRFGVIRRSKTVKAGQRLLLFSFAAEAADTEIRMKIKVAFIFTGFNYMDEQFSTEVTEKVTSNGSKLNVMNLTVAHGLPVNS
jgi:hypothetical protein